jgi:hypothetical protein
MEEAAMSPGSEPMPLFIAKAIAYLFVTVIVLVGPGLLVGAAVGTVRQASFVYSSTRTEGTIVELHWVSGRRGFSYAPAFRFTDEDGQTHTLVSSVASYPSPFSVGERIEVLYPPGDPLHAKIDSVGQLWRAQIACGVLGAALSVFPVQIYLRRRRRGIALET